MKEEWKEIEGFEGKYYISNYGRLKSIGGRYKKSLPEGYITNGATDSLGYKVVMLRKPKQKRVIVRVHVLVARSFIKNPDNKTQVNHIDSNKSNNHILNLEWVTQKENLYHAIRVGRLNNKGSKHGMSKLNESQVKEIRRLRKEEKLTHQKIADMFHVNRRHIGDIINGINWGWL